MSCDGEVHRSAMSQGMPGAECVGWEWVVDFGQSLGQYCVELVGGEGYDFVVIWWVESLVNVGQHLCEQGRVEGVVWVLSMLICLGGSQVEVEVLVGEKDISPGEGSRVLRL